jgi:hypothetical protein
MYGASIDSTQKAPVCWGCIACGARIAAGGIKD